ncbi:MAG: hypothetical protein P8018_04320 [Acidobacteriota bacterium]|jgi:hypothetical protein
MIGPVPSVDPIPIPAPLWLLKTLADATLFIHMLLMDLVWGGTLLTAVYCFKGKPKHFQAARSLARTFPYVFPFVITFGVAPLLFLQVLYGPVFYTSSILVGTPFILIIPTVIAAYALMYFLSWRWERLGAWRGWISLLIFALLGFVGFVFSNVFSLMADPGRFLQKYLAHPSGFQLNLAEPSLPPRFLHMFFAAVAVAGLWVAITGIKRLHQEPDQARWQCRSGATWFAGATVIEILVGIWWLLDLPSDQVRIFMGGGGLSTAAFMVGVVCALLSVVFALVGINSVKPFKHLHMAAMFLGLTVLCMVVMRDALRDAALKPFYTLSKLAVSPQWGAIILFFLLFAGGLGVVVWLLIVAAKARPKPEQPKLGSGKHRLPEEYRKSTVR